MKITKQQLRKIIKEELEAVIAEEDDDLIDELFPKKSMTLQEGVDLLVDIIDFIDLGTTLWFMAGAAGTAAAGKAREARAILKHVGEEAHQLASEKRRILQGVMGNEALEKMIEYLNNDDNLNAMVVQYHDLVAQVAKIKGKRGKEFQTIRAERKRVAQKLSAAIDAAIEKAWEYANIGADFAPEIPSKVARAATVHVRRKR